MLDTVWLWGLYYGSVRLHSKSCKLSFDPYKSLFRCQVAVLYYVVGNVLIVKGFFRILIYMVEVGVVDFFESIQLAADAAG